MKRVHITRRTAKPITRQALEMTDGKLLICGCIGLSHFSDTKISVRRPKSTVTVEGISLKLMWAGNGKILIYGCIKSISLGGEA